MVRKRPRPSFLSPWKHLIHFTQHLLSLMTADETLLSTLGEISGVSIMWHPFGNKTLYVTTPSSMKWHKKWDWKRKGAFPMNADPFSLTLYSLRSRKKWGPPREQGGVRHQVSVQVILATNSRVQGRDKMTLLWSTHKYSPSLTHTHKQLISSS